MKKIIIKSCIMKNKMGCTEPVLIACTEETKVSEMVNALTIKFGIDKKFGNLKETQLTYCEFMKFSFYKIDIAKLTD